MLTSFAIMLILGIAVNALFERIKLPGLLGMLLLGIGIGPAGLDLLSPGLYAISPELRLFAIIVILLRAGLGIYREDLKTIGFSAIKLSFIPGLFEGLTIAWLATQFWGFTFVEGGVLGFIIAAATPAIIVPLMLGLIEKKLGTKQGIPALILAGASLDDVFIITIFTVFLGLYTGSQVNIGIQLLGIPISIILGVGLGVLLGLALAFLFCRLKMRDTHRVLILLSVAFLMTAVESWLKGYVEFAALLGVMAVGFVLLERSPIIAKRMSEKLSKIWIFAEIMLFVLIGAQVNISLVFEQAPIGLLVILIGLLSRSVGVLVSLAGSPLKWKERLFCIIAYTPKATVQAAIGAIPLSLGMPMGELILAIAFLSILLTAPLGALGIRQSAGYLLTPEISDQNAVAVH